MRLFTRRFLALAAMLATINVVGLILLSRQSPPGRSSSASEPDPAAAAAVATAEPALPAAPLRVVAVSPFGDVRTADVDRVVIAFDRPVVDADAVDGIVAIEPFAIQPRPSGRWTWTERDRLAFLPDEPLAPGHRFVVHPTSNLVAALGQQLDPTAPAEWWFQTDRLEVASLLLRSSDDDVATAEITFSHPVSLREFDRALRVTLDRIDLDLPVDVAAVDDSGDRTFRLRVARPSVVTVGEAALAQGLVAPDGGVNAFLGSFNFEMMRFGLRRPLFGADFDPAAELGLAADWRTTLSLAPPLALKSARYVKKSDNYWSGRKPAHIEVLLTRDLQAEQDPGLLDAITVEPPVDRIEYRVDGPRLMLVGDFQPRRTYTVQLPVGVRGGDGQALRVPLELTVHVPSRSPQLAVPVSRGILMPSGNLLFDVDTVNIPAIEVGAYRVLENNLVAHLHGSRPDRTARPLPAATRTLEIGGERDVDATVAVDLRALLAAGGDVPLGIYGISVESTDNRWQSRTAVIAITDLGITARRERDGYVVWVTSLSTAQPVPGVVVTARTATNQRIGEATTDDDGIARLVLPEAKPDGDAWVLIASHGEDRSYLQPERRPLVLDTVEQSGRPYADTFEAMLYGERGAYRPGDTLQLTGLVRGATGELPPALPMLLEIQRPDGRVVAELPVDVESATQGFFHTAWESPAEAQVGRYTARLYPPGTRRTADGRRMSADAIGSTAVLVEEFERVRLEVDAAFTVPQFAADEPIELEATGRYLFGTPAAGLDAAFSGTMFRESFASQRYPDHAFTALGVGGRARGIKATAPLDDDGRVTMEIPRGATESSPPGRWRLDGALGVTEVGGRTVSRWVRARVDTAERFVGLRTVAVRGGEGGGAVEAGRTGWLPIGTPLEYQWVCVDGRDDPAEVGGLSIVLERIDRTMQLQEERGRLIWRSTERTEQLEEWAFDAATEGRFAVLVAEPGRYRLTVRPSDDENAARVAAAQISFHAARSGAEYAALATERPERVELSLDQADYAPGGTAILSMRTAFTGGGTALVTVETDRVLAQRVVTLDGRDGQVELPVDESLRGGGFITVSVVRAIDPGRDTWMPHRAAGMVRLPVGHDDRRLGATFDAPEQVEPGVEVAVALDVRGVDGASLVPAGPGEPPAMAHVWAVDEGLLQVTRHATPDPHAYFLGARRSFVRSADLFADLMPDTVRTDTVDRIGGDQAESSMPRRGLVDRPREIPAVIWRAAVPVDADGTVRTTFVAPAMQGRLRLMAVVAEGDRYGAAEHGMVIASPVTVRSAWPRAAAVGDTFEVAVTVFNHTEDAVSLPLAIRVDGPLVIDDAALAAPLEIAAGGSAVRWVPVTARGAGSVRVRIEAGGSVVADAAAGDAAGVLGRPEPALDGAPAPLFAVETATLAVRPAGILQTRATLATVTAGTPIELDPTAGFVPGTVTARLRVAGDPSVDLLPAVDQLMQYPHGCAEQTTSQLIALLSLPELITVERARADRPDASFDDARAAAIRQMVRAGIDRLATMQTRDGGIAYWPGRSTSRPWVSGYAGWFLVQAQRAGHDVDATMLGDLLDHLERTLTGVRPARDLDDPTRAFICRTLAEAGRPQPSWIGGLEAVAPELDMAGRAHLAAALFELGRRDRALAVLGEDLTILELVPTTTGRFTSAVHQAAALLDVLLTIDPQHPWVPRLAEDLDRRRTGGHWGTTVSNAAAIRALARYRSMLPPPLPFTGTVSGVGAETSPALISSAEPATFQWDSGGAGDEPVRIVLDGAAVAEGADAAAAADAPDAADAPGAARAQARAHVAMVVQGLVPAADAAETDRSLRVRRTWLDADGEPVDPAALVVGDLVQVEVTLSLTSHASRRVVHNIAVVDLLPGGLEAENPRLASSGGPSGSRGVAAPGLRTQFLDDRVVFFTSAGSRERTFRYACRVTTSGSFLLPPIEATCMYDPMLTSVHGAGRIEVGR